MIREFEEECDEEKGNSSGQKRKLSKAESGAKSVPAKKKAADDRLTGFDRGLKAEKILGAADFRGEMMFLMKWKNCDKPELVPSKIANVKCPGVVIRFYEENLAIGTANSCNVRGKNSKRCA